MIQPVEASVSDKIATTPKRLGIESVLDYAIQMAHQYRSKTPIGERKDKGQIFTPKEVAAFMASLLTLRSKKIRLLDPGAGTGILTAAICERILSSKIKTLDLTVDFYENDPAILPFLKKTLASCQTALENHGHKAVFNVFREDFILQNYTALECHSGNLPLFSQSVTMYDSVISNPPYYKLNKESPQSVAMKNIVYGQPNIYAFFMALSLAMLKPGGELIFITPRSFCSGLYYKKFRTWFLEEMELKHVHNFISRNLVFREDDVLQENVILNATKSKARKANHRIAMSVSESESFTDCRTFSLEKEKVIHRKNGDLFIRIPSSEPDMQITGLIDELPNVLKDIGMEISTGPVVSFRAKTYLRSEFCKEDSVPLLWMHNLREWDIKWPHEKNGKEKTIVNNERTKKLLLPIKNYVLLKRFTSKEQKRRLYASVMLQPQFSGYESIGIENHVNYIHRFKDLLTEAEAFGIAGILDTIMMDSYFRSLNGNTQVNAGDIRSMPLPSREKICAIGEEIRNHKPPIGMELDLMVAKKLGIAEKLVMSLYAEAGLLE